MAAKPETKYVKQYEPDNQARVELVNGRIVDVTHGRYHETGTRIIVQGGEIVAMPGRQGEPAAVQADFSIDLQGARCYCGNPGCVETKISGTGVEMHLNGNTGSAPRCPTSSRATAAENRAAVGSSNSSSKTSVVAWAA